MTWDPLAPGAWISRSDRRRLEQQLVGGSNPPAASGASASFEHLAIDGDHAFVRATQHALGLLRRTSSWPLVGRLRCIRQCDTGWPVGGWLIGDVAEFEPCTWQGDPRFYASSIAHEAMHANGADGSGDGERACLGVQVQALRELGAPRDMIEAIAEHQRNPTPFHMK
jgi:hypothetical protein